MTCPTCRKPSRPRFENPTFPFCSERCRLVDLGRWLGEEFRVPGEPAPAADSEPKPDDGPEHGHS